MHGLLDKHWYWLARHNPKKSHDPFVFIKLDFWKSTRGMPSLFTSQFNMRRDISGREQPDLWTQQ